MNEAELIQRLPSDIKRLKQGLARRIVGMDDVVERVLFCLLCNSHGLLVGVPGLAKTLLCSSMAEMLDLEFKRIQFTPDLMPSDVVGTETLGELQDGQRGFRFVQGPIFTNLLLADEINRTPPKTQAALMEAMEEATVTSGGVRRELSPPFIVLATQNPIEQEGTYELPAAQRDRFLVCIYVSYPSELDERQIVRRTTAGKVVELETVLSRDEIVAIQEYVRRQTASDDVMRYATQLARATRPDASEAAEYAHYVSWGAGPRGAQSLVMAAKARAILNGQMRARCSDVRAVMPAVLRHRIIPSYHAGADGIDTDAILKLVLRTVRAPDGWRPPEPVQERTGWLARLFRRNRPAAAAS